MRIRDTAALALILALPIGVAMFYADPGSQAYAAETAKLDGKAIFLAQKCNMCHSIPPAGIEATTKSEKMKGPDLVDLKPSADTLGKFLRKEVEKNGKKHAKAFVGSDEELGALIAWLQAQKKG